MTTVAYNLLLYQVFKDGNIDESERIKILQGIFDPLNPEKQADKAKYDALRGYLAQYSKPGAFVPTLQDLYFDDERNPEPTQPSGWRASLANLVGGGANPKKSSDREVFTSLLRGFPGNLEKFTREINGDLGLHHEMIDVPTIEFHDIVRDKKNKNLYRISFDLQRVSLDPPDTIEIEIDTTKPIAGQECFKNQEHACLFSDIFALINDLYTQNTLGPQETKYFLEVSHYFQSNSNVPPPPLPDRNVEVVSSYDWSLEGLQPVDGANEIIPVSSDGTLDEITISKVINEVEKILGPKILELLDESGYRVSFINFNDQGNLIQQNR